MIEYRQGNQLAVDEVADLYRSCTLGARRPVDDQERFAAMIANADLIWTAWDGPLLVGISRSVTDWVYTTYLADLAVRESHQRQGIGLELIKRTQQAAPKARIVLLAAPQAVDYYPHIGFERHHSAWTLPPRE